MLDSSVVLCPIVSCCIVPVYIGFELLLLWQSLSRIVIVYPSLQVGCNQFLVSDPIFLPNQIAYNCLFHEDSEYIGIWIYYGVWICS